MLELILQYQSWLFYAVCVFAFLSGHKFIKSLLAFVHLSHDRQRLTTIQLTDPVIYAELKANGEFEKLRRINTHALFALLWFDAMIISLIFIFIVGDKYASL